MIFPKLPKNGMISGIFCPWWVLGRGRGRRMRPEQPLDSPMLIDLTWRFTDVFTFRCVANVGLIADGNPQIINLEPYCLKDVRPLHFSTQNFLQW